MHYCKMLSVKAVGALDHFNVALNILNYLGA